MWSKLTLWLFMFAFVAVAAANTALAGVGRLDP